MYVLFSDWGGEGGVHGVIQVGALSTMLAWTRSGNLGGGESLHRDLLRGVELETSIFLPVDSIGHRGDSFGVQLVMLFGDAAGCEEEREGERRREEGRPLLAARWPGNPQPSLGVSFPLPRHGER